MADKDYTFSKGIKYNTFYPILWCLLKAAESRKLFLLWSRLYLDKMFKITDIDFVRGTKSENSFLYINTYFIVWNREKHSAPKNIHVSAKKLKARNIFYFNLIPWWGWLLPAPPLYVLSWLRLCNINSGYTKIQ